MKNYLSIIEKLLAENKTSGENHSEAMLHYSRMNFKRMERWVSKGVLLSETLEVLGKIEEDQYWTVLTEAWCGDAAHSLPFIFKMAEANPHIHIEWKWRDENLELMDQFLTNGGRSIPKLIVRDKAQNILFDWGPRPAIFQTKYMELKNDGKPYEEISVELQKLYNGDKGKLIQQEIASKLVSSIAPV